MRQGQQNRRGRGRNRKSQNPLTRSFESNGPDVKIRGTPSHIAEKYISMARDALASGDPVLAENYLQHAEHYNRIIMTYREQQVNQGEGLNGGGRHRQADGGDGDDAQPHESDEVPPGQEPQPSVGSDNNDTHEANGGERPRRRMNGARNGPRRRRNEAAQNNTTEDADASGSTERAPRRREAFTEGDDQPEFLKRPVRRTRRSQPAAESEEGEAEANPTPSSADEAAE